MMMITMLMLLVMMMMMMMIRENNIYSYFEIAVYVIFSNHHHHLLSEKVHATIPKGIVGGFECSVLQRNLKKLARKATDICLRVLKESNKSMFDSYSRQE